MWGKSYTRRFSLSLCSSLVIFVLLGFLAFFLTLKTFNKISFNSKALAQGSCSPDYIPGDAQPAVLVDKDVYSFGEPVLITGEGNECGVDLVVNITRPDNVQETVNVTTDDHGEFAYIYEIDGAGGEGVYQVDVLSGDGINILASRSFNVLAVTVTTDKPDYSPGESVIISGSGWEPGETVTFLLQEDPEMCADRELDPAVADETGSFSTFGFNVEAHDVGVTFLLTAIGQSSGLVAGTTFMDSINIFNDCFDLGSGDTGCTDDSDDSNTVDSTNAPVWSDGDAGGDDCMINNEELRLRSNCAVSQTSISTVGYTNIHLLYLWGADVDVAGTAAPDGDDGDLVVDWRVTAGSFVPVNTHDLTGDLSTTNSIDFPLDNDANNTTIEIRFKGSTSEDADQAFVDNVIV